MHPLLKDIREGDLCRFTYKKQSGNGQWYEHTCVAVYLGTHGPDAFDVSFRPLAGTTTFGTNQLVSVERLAAFHERREHGQHRQDSRVSLPKRKKGAVPAP